MTIHFLGTGPNQPIVQRNPRARVACDGLSVRLSP